MNKEEYKDFQLNFKNGSEGMKALSSGGCPGCEECGIEEGAEEYYVQPSFSRSSCNICNSHLGGDRHPAHYLDSDKDIVHLEICVDCMYYMEYGQLDDMTMMDMEKGT